MRKRKVNYPPPRNQKRPPAPGAGPEVPQVRPTVASIDVSARQGRGQFAIGDRVRITAAGLYSGETAIVETIVGGVIPAALVRTEAGRTRRVRTIDLEPVSEPLLHPVDDSAPRDEDSAAG